MDTNQPNQTEPSDLQETASQSGSPDNPEVLSPENLQPTPGPIAPGWELSDETPSTIPPSVIQTAILQVLRRTPPDKLPDLATKIADQYHDRQTQAQSNNHQITLHTIRAIVLVIIISLGYAAYTGDSNLPDKLFAYFLGTATGGGISALLNRPKP
jgi:hypothetical protein